MQEEKYMKFDGLITSKTQKREKEVVHNNNNNNMLMLQSHKVIFSTPHHILILQHIRATLSVCYNFSTVLDLLDEILNYIFLTHRYILDDRS